MSDDINDLHKQIKSLLHETVGGKGSGADKNGAPRMAASERKMLAKARQACGPHAGSEWRKAAI
ncbi:hypothetical protein RJ527_00115 [Thalassospiraceae bacterium LMO-SO8]|nr:hypothetical protein [Alphaproteobacteria bacterium LMO-S08]WND76160.1 hypothetical protein RJ527_00115 [Thalassospiraceae bacterium LMO-SO8]